MSFLDSVNFRRLKEEAIIGGNFGTADKPVVLEDINVFQAIMRYQFRHVHDLDGNCVKNRYGAICE